MKQKMLLAGGVPALNQTTKLRNDLNAKSLFKNKFLMIFIYCCLFLTTSSEILCQAEGDSYLIELGVSYDDAYEELFNSPEEAISTIETMVDIVNDMYDKSASTVDITFNLVITRKINIYTDFPDRIRRSSSNFWNLTTDLCNKVDMAHHITGPLRGNDGQAGGGTSATCGFGIESFNAGKTNCSLSEYAINSLSASAYNMAHELGHHLGMSHPPSCGSLSRNTDFMCSPVLLQQDNNYEFTSFNLNSFKNILSSNNCLIRGEVNVNVMNPECPNCDPNVVITNISDTNIKVELGCEVEPVYEIESSFSNNCVEDRNYKFRFSYNDNDLEVFDLESNIQGPFDILGSPSYNKYYETNWKMINMGNGEINKIKVKIKNSSSWYSLNLNPPFSTGSLALVNYYIDPPSPVKDPNGPSRPLSGNFPINFIFEYNYQIDKRNNSIVKASELTVPDVLDPLNFCNNRKFDIYIDGQFEIDINQKYCDANFYFNPDSKIVVKANKTLDLSGCLLTTCRNIWDGIELEQGAKVIMENTVIEKSKIGIKSGLAGNIVEIKNGCVFDGNLVGMDLTNTRVLNLSGSTIKNGDKGLIINNCGLVTSNNCNYINLKDGINSNKTSLNINGGQFTGKSNYIGIGINLLGEGNYLLLRNNVRIANWRNGVVSIKSRIYSSGTQYNGNYIGCHILNSNGFVHDINNDTYANGAYGLISALTTLGGFSRIEGCTFDNLDHSISISNQLSLEGWYINSDFTNVKNRGVKANNSYNTNISGSNLTGLGLQNSRMISLEGGMYNQVSSNTINTGPASNESNQSTGIYTASFGNSYFCNTLSNGIYGINVWGDASGYYANNSFNSQHTGLYCGLYPANGTSILGRQRHYFNIWNNGSFNYGAKHLSQDPPLIQRSNFIVDINQSQTYRPFPISSVDPNWFTNELTLKTPLDCWDFDPDNPNPPQRNSLQSTDNIQELNPYSALIDKEKKIKSHPIQKSINKEKSHTSIGVTQINQVPYDTNLSLPSGIKIFDASLINTYIAGELQFGQYNDELNITADLHTYYALKSNYNGELQTIPERNSFLNLHESSNIGKLYEAERLIASTRYNTTKIKIMIDSLHLLSNDIVNALNNNQTASISIIDLAVGINDQIMASYSDSRTQHLGDILTANLILEQISDASLPITNKKLLLIAEGKIIINDSLDNQDLNIIRSIADQCPLASGDAVYGARGILESKEGYVEYDDYFLCLQTEERKKYINEGINVTPNPTSGFITISCKDNIYNIIISDMTGNILVNTEGNNSFIQEIDITSLQNGIYFVKILHGKENNMTVSKVIKVE